MKDFIDLIITSTVSVLFLTMVFVLRQQEQDVSKKVLNLEQQIEVIQKQNIDLKEELDFCKQTNDLIIKGEW